MRSSINDILTANRNFARPNLFEVTINPKGKKLSENQLLLKRLNINCHTAEIPGQNIATGEKDVGYRQYGFQMMYTDLTLGFYVNADMKEVKIFRDWMDQIVRPWNRVGYYDKYKSEMSIKCLDRQQKETMTVRIEDAYPKSLSAIPLQYGSNDEIMNISITFVYRVHTYVFPTEDQNQPRVARSVNAEINKIDPMREIIDPEQNFKFRGDTAGSNDEFDNSEFE